MKYVFAAAAFFVLVALSIALQPAKAITREGPVITLNEIESAMCGADGDCILVNEAGVEAEIQKRVRQALEVCRSYTKGES